MPPLKSEYEVERIVSDKYLVGRRFFFVKWRGFNSTYNTWEPEENLDNCPRLVREYFGGKGLSNTSKSQRISSTLMRCMKVSKTRRSSMLALASPKSSRRSSVSSQTIKVNVLQLTKVDKLEPAETKNLQLAKVDELQPAGAHDVQFARTSDLQPAKANKMLFAESNDSQSATVNDLSPIGAEADNLQTTETKVCDFNSNISKTEPAAEVVVTQSILSQHTGASMAEPSGKLPTTSLEGGKLLSSMGLTLKMPKIELVKLEDDATCQSLGKFSTKESELLRLGLIAANRSPSSSADFGAQRRSRRSRRPTVYLRQFTYSLGTSRSPKDKKAVLHQSFSSTIDLTADSMSSTDETGFNSSQMLSDNDRSWQNSTIADCKFPNKLQVRLFDRTPRPEVLSSVPILENFESDTDTMSQWVTEDSDKENVTVKGRRGRLPPRNRAKISTKKPKISNCDRRGEATRRSKMLETAQVTAEDLPKTDDAMVLLAEQNEAGASNMLMYFPRLKIVKSLPTKMADKYYSQAVIDYYRRSMQPPVRVARRSC